MQDRGPVDRDALPVRLWRHLRILQPGADRGGDGRRGLGDGDHAGLPVRGLALHRDRERDGVPLADLSPTVNRWTNIVLPSLYVVSIVASAIGETSAYYWFLSIAESALLLLIVWYAWTWPRVVSGTG
jgi:hypothetical protein